MIKLRQSISGNRRISTFFYWTFILVILFFFHSSHQLNPDDGVILNGAWNLINGRRLYLDFFSFIPPASFYLVYVVWKIIGVSFWSIQIVSILIFFLAIIGIYKISQEICPSKYNYLFPPFVVLASPWFWLINHNIYNFSCLVWATYFIVAGIKKGPIKNFLWAGVITGFSVLFLQQKGLIFWGATSLFILVSIIRKKKPWRTLLIYNFFAFLPLSLLLFWPGRLLYFSLVDFPVFHYIESNRISYAIFLCFFLVFIVTYWFFYQEKKEEVKFLLFIQFFLLISALVLPDFYHIFLMIFPLLVLGPFIFEKIASTHPGRPGYYLIPGVVVLVIFMYSLLGTIKLCSSAFPKEFVKAVKNNCSGPYLYVGPFMPGLYFETRKLSATPFDILITGQQTLDQFISARKFLEKNKPECAILIYTKSLDRFNYNQDNPVDNYIKANYLLMNNSKNQQGV